MAKAKTRQPPPETVADRINHMLPAFEMLIAETNRLIDQYVDEIEAPRCPGVPKAILRALTVEKRAGTMLNYAEALRFLRHARVS